MAEDFYSDGSEAPAPEAESEMEGKVETSTIPKSLCPGMKVGDSVELKIVGELDSEYEVAYEEAETGEEEMPETEEMPSAPAEMPAPPGPMSEMMS